MGESARSGYERGCEHQYDYETESKESHMFKHFTMEHQNDEKPKFSMKIVKTHQSALNRQIHEAIMILSNESVILNSRGEYNRCPLPRLSVMMGEREVIKKDNIQSGALDLEDLNSDDSKRKEHPSITLRMRKKREKNEIFSAKGSSQSTSPNQELRRQKRTREPEGASYRGAFAPKNPERDAKVARIEGKSIPAGPSNTQL